MTLLPLRSEYRDVSVCMSDVSCSREMLADVIKALLGVTFVHLFCARMARMVLDMNTKPPIRRWRTARV